MKFIIFSLPAICIICIANILQAQSFSGFTSANMSGIAASSFQPANLYVQGSSFDIAYLELNTSFQTNLFQLDPVKKFRWQYDGNLYGFAVAENHIQFPSFGIALGKRATLGLSFSVNHFLNAHFTPKISADLMSKYQKAEMQDVVRTNQEAYILFNSWYALGFSYARLIKEDRLGLLKMGFTGQILIGNGGIAAKTALLEYEVPFRRTLDVEQFFFSSSISHNFDNYQQLRWLWKPEQKMGLGYNTKFGIKWERTKRLHRKPRGIKLDQVGVALLDLGRVAYRSGPYNFLTFHEEGRSVIDIEETFEGMKTWESLRDTINHYSPIVPLRDIWAIAMPASLYVEVNILLNKHFAINSTLLKSLHILEENNLSRNSGVTFTPYFYNDSFSLGFPLSLSLKGKGHVGIAFYKGPLMLGVDYIEESFNGFTFKNFGLHIIMHRNPIKQERKRDLEICRSL